MPRHPYQDQVDKMWDLIKRNNLAKKNGFWLESMSLSYILLEIELRLLLSSKAGRSRVPIPPRIIDDQDYLMKLANLAKRKGFIDAAIWKRIYEFNDARRKAIHGLAQGKILYADLKKHLDISELIYDIQSRWLPMKFWPEEHMPQSAPVRSKKI